VSGGGAKDFSDAHCDKAVTPGTGAFGHVLFAENAVTNLTATNNLTGEATEPAVLEYVLGGVVTEIKCTTVSTTGTVTNKGPSTAMKVEFGESSTSFTGCTTQKPAVCAGTAATVATTKALTTAPTTLGLGGKKTQTGEEVQVLEEGKGTEKGLKFMPPTGKNFTEVTLSSACGLGTTPFPIKGFFYSLGGRGGNATSSGATEKLTRASSLGGLTTGGNPASLTASLTFRRSGGNPLTITTTSS
jgi:hypothetical protein